MLDDFMFRAALAGVGTAVAAAPLGCFVVWRRLAYFGDATAHAAILGVALALALDVSIFGGVVVAALAMGTVVSTLSGRGFAADTVLGVLAHSALAFGLVAVSFLSGVQVDLMGYLLGDILAVSRTDLLLIWGGAGVIVALIGLRWSALLTATVGPDLAMASGIDPRREQMVLTFSLALTVAIAIKVVGVLLIAALLVIPAATARGLARTPEAMALSAGATGSVAAVGGLGGSFMLDTPTGPTIVCLAALMFVVSVLLSGLQRTH
ncbi:metal ABC transporter permease [Tropicimonas isoalkanivorans]|uniref:High-affinity zinc uptake system membrane protein ZnuB n=1 Tax=Tropicimonas isoalkanivorans TaxID=441112 RepID=A0A1I1FRL5_9RHOB|nr:metal ABC transporter permease [Tropicimonas isoalkanivorans]SFC01984.1 zinc transport system permease protein [Tropicimonas isoalkanivorans]